MPTTPPTSSRLWASTSYGYDSNGNQTSRASDSFAWDHENRLASATVASTATTYTYNADGLRQTRASGGTTTSYVWDVVGLPRLLQDGTNTYVYGLGLISTTDGSGNQTYPLHDGLGSTVALANGSGTVTGTYAYDVFGAVRSHSGGTTEFGFTGEQNDPNALEYLRARYYDPAIGRFVSQDPCSAEISNPQTLNRYSYAQGNSVNSVDPSGCFAIHIPCAVCSVVNAVTSGISAAAAASSSAANAAVGFIVDNAETISLLTGLLAAIPTPLTPVFAGISMGTAAIAAAQHISNGNYLGAALDLLGVGLGAGAYLERLAALAREYQSVMSLTEFYRVVFSTTEEAAMAQALANSMRFGDQAELLRLRAAGLDLKAAYLTLIELGLLTPDTPEPTP